MERKKVFILVGSVGLILMLAVLPFMAACAQPAPAPAEPIVLKGLGFLPTTHPHTQKWLHFIEMVNERTNGELTIDYLGGHEVIPMIDAPLALLEGIVDIIQTGDTFYKSLAPGAHAMGCRTISMEEERKIGYHDLMVELHEKAGFYYLGNGAPSGGPEFYLWLNREASGLEDIKGAKIASMMSIAKVCEELGMIPAPMASAEIYTALERGVVDGYIGSITGVYPRGFHEVLEVCIDHPFWSQSMPTLLSMDSWNRIPQNLQDRLIEVQIEYEQWAEEILVKDFAEHRELLTEAGIQFVKFPPNEAEVFVDAFYQSSWDWIVENDPVYGPQLKDLLD